MVEEVSPCLLILSLFWKLEGCYNSLDHTTHLLQCPLAYSKPPDSWEVMTTSVSINAFPWMTTFSVELQHCWLFENIPEYTELPQETDLKPNCQVQVHMWITNVILNQIVAGTQAE